MLGNIIDGQTDLVFDFIAEGGAEYKKNKRPFLGHITLSNRSTVINYRG